MILVYGFDVSLMNTSNVACREHTYLRYVTTVASISCPCWAAFDQYVSTSRQANVRKRWSSIRVVRLVIISTILFWILFYIPVIFFCDIENGLCMLKAGPYRTINTYVFTPFVYGVGPAGVITYCTLGTMRNLRLSTIKRSSKRLTTQVRAMLIPQLITLAISGIPFGFQGIYLDMTSNIEKSAVRVALENFIGQIILIFYHFNYVFTFYIYVYKSSEVRKGLKQQIFKYTRMGNVTQDDRVATNS
ncbi:hypothetical protein NGRA_3143, partial [Nosema granulosis]